MAPPNRGGTPQSTKGAGLGPETPASVLFKQKTAIEKIREQNAKLKEELLLENKFSVRSSNQEAANLINKLQDDADVYTRIIQLEQRKSLMLEQQEQEMSQQLKNTRQCMGSITAAREQSQAALKQITLLENRLDKCFIRFNEAVTHNKQLRAQIDGLRRERLMFEALDATLQKELLKTKADMAELIQAANAMHMAKEVALAEVAQLKAAMDKEQAAYEEEWGALTKMIEEDRRAQEEARLREMAIREEKTKELLRNKDGLGPAARKKSVKAPWGSPGGKGNAASLSMERLNHYQAACDKVMQGTGMRNMEDLLAAFAAAEDEAYTLFTYVNDVNAEVEKLEDQVNVGRAEVTQALEQGAEWDTMQRTTASTESEALLSTVGRSRGYEQRCEAVAGALGALREPIWELFNRLGCNTPAVRELLGGEQVDEGNLMSYLGVIEQRANELLQAYAMTLGSEDSEQLRTLLTGRSAPPPDRRIIIDLPSTTSVQEADSSVPGEEAEPETDMPLTRAALQERIQRSLATKIDTMIRVRPVVPDAVKKQAAKAGK